MDTHAKVVIWLKGWRDGRLFADAVNDPAHPMHEAAWPVYCSSYRAWQPGDPVYRAVEYDMPADMDDDRICENAFERFNIGDPRTDNIVGKYRGAGHRSLSVGDVVQIRRGDDRPTEYTCASFGWNKLEHFVHPPRG